MTSAVRRFEILAKSPNFGDFAKNPNHDFALVPDHGRVRLVDVVLGQLSVLLKSFSSRGEYRLNFGRGPSQNPQKLTLAALKFGGGNVKNRRFQLGLVRFLPGFYRNTHRELVSPPPHSMGVVSLRGCPGGGLNCRRLIKKNFEKRQFEGLLLYGWWFLSV